ncbi:MAG: sulfatase-like hydrolase/transferase [Phycisphaerae bacterium]|nr:sulfatase-like hydrolase/transferase [Phycisphaerae bacterium]
MRDFNQDCEKVLPATGSRARIVGVVLLAALSGAGSLAATAAEPRQPNILFLFTDDQRADTIGALGNPHIQTPTLDSLVREGFVFRNTYCFGGNSPAVCLPSRNMLLSGRAYFRWEGPYAPADQPNVPVAMKTAGYVTYHHGKKGNTARLIQERFDINKYVNEKVDREEGQPGRAIVDDAITFLRERTNDKPFFMYLAFANPHDPRIAAQRFLDRYEPGAIPLPKNFLPQHPFDNGEPVIRDELLAGWPRRAEEIQRHLRDYYAVITGLDFHIGRLLQTLRELGLDKNTIIVFSSDNGLAIGSHGLMGKQNLYEHSAKVPLIIAGPGVPRGGSDALVYLLDLFPTFCEWASAPIPTGLDGKSLKPILDGKTAGVRETLFLAYRDVQRAVRDERWKLIRYPRINRTQLFDLKEDADERQNLADDPAQAKRVTQMLTQIERWQRQLGDSAPLASEDPQDAAFTPPSGKALEALLERWKMN